MTTSPSSCRTTRASAPEVQVDYPGYRSTRLARARRGRSSRCRRSCTRSTGRSSARMRSSRARRRPDAPARRRAARRADRRQRPRARRGRDGRSAARSSRSGRRTPPAATATTSTSIRRRSTRTSPARAAASPTTTGSYRFVTIKPGAYPWGNHENAWRPAHIHFSLFGRAFTQRLVTQMYFPGDPLFAYDPIFNAVRDPKARALLVSQVRPRDDASPTGRSATAGTSCSVAADARRRSEDMTLQRHPRRRSARTTRSGSAGGRENELVPPDEPARSSCAGSLLDGDGDADPRRHGRDLGRRPSAVGADAARTPTAAFSFVVAKPAAAGGEAPHLDVFVFARGLLRHQRTRDLLPGRARCERRRSGARGARRGRPRDARRGADGEALRFDIRMQGDRADGLLRALSPFAAIFVPDELRGRACRTAPGSRRCSRRSARSRTRRRSRASSRRTRRPRSPQALRAELYDVDALASRAARREPGRAARARDPRAGRRRARALRAPRRDEPGHPRHGGDARRAATRCALIDAELGRRRRRAARAWPRSTGDTVMAARTLLQQAVPTTFGLQGGGLARRRSSRRARGSRAVAAARAARRRGRNARRARRHGLEVLRALRARSSSCASPRSRGTRSAHAVRASSRARSPARPARARRSALDVVLLAQTEVGEVRRGATAAAPRRCRTSATRSSAVLARACARHARANAGVLLECVGAGARARGRRLARGVGGALRRARGDRRRGGGDARGRSTASRSTPSACARTSPPDDAVRGASASALDARQPGGLSRLGRRVRRPRARALPSA